MFMLTLALIPITGIFGICVIAKNITKDNAYAVILIVTMEFILLLNYINVIYLDIISRLG